MTSSETRSGFALAKFEYSSLIGQYRSLRWSRDTFLIKLRLYGLILVITPENSEFALILKNIKCEVNQSFLLFLTKSGRSNKKNKREEVSYECPYFDLETLIFNLLCKIDRSH